mmetsp:Transcript_23034/g.31532  ORF Transcript_23034/g.31532 Transcript_23034/m.31532 type:complete len:108 (-) Transcript_23034:14-337(-)
MANQDVDVYTQSIGMKGQLGAAMIGCLGNPLADVVSTSRSGSIFFSTCDKRYMIKTIATEEETLLHRILPSYWCHISEYPNSLLTRFFGLHRLKGEGVVGGKEIPLL